MVLSDDKSVFEVFFFLLRGLDILGQVFCFVFFFFLQEIQLVTTCLLS